MSSSVPKAEESSRKKDSAKEAGLAATSELWGREDGTWYRDHQWIHWSQHPRVKERQSVKVALRRDWDIFYYWIRAYLHGRLPVKRALSLGCGIGGLERGLAKYGFAEQHLGLDISPGAVKKAAQLAADQGLEGLRYEVADLNVVELPRRSFDVVLGVSAVHHVEELERLFEQVDGALKEDGYFFMDEFVGPNQFQWRPEQIDLANRVLRKIPRRFRRSIAMPGKIKEHVAVHTVEEMNRVDPTESIRAEDILPLARRAFDVVEIKGYGGTLLHLILDDIAGNFRPGDEDADSVLDMLFEIEDLAIAGGLLQHDFAAVVARRRSLKARRKHERMAGIGLRGLDKSLSK